VHATGIDKKNTCSNLFTDGYEMKFVFMCNKFTGPPEIGQCKLASKQVVLFYSASNLLPAGGVQSVQGTEGNSTNKLCLKRTAE